MKRISVLFAGLFMIVSLPPVMAATRGQSVNVSRGGATASATTRTATARSAITARAAAPTAPAVSARAATTGRTTVSRTSASTASTPTVAARAASTQKVLNTGTSVAVANENTAVDNSCRQKYYGCMDSFCMLDNESGGRCICSDKNAEYDAMLAEIELLDQQSYQMATLGVESIESGFDVASAKNLTTSVANSISGGGVDLSMWNMNLDDGAESSNPLDGKTGDALFAAAHQICAQSIPECSGELNMLQLMYSQQIRSDCSAYENSLTQQQNASQEKLAAAQAALRQASYTQLRDANKYDLGQCTVEFKNCMMTTGGCGDDFSGCASVAAFDATNSNGRGISARPHLIHGSLTDIEISASTYDILMSKKPLCESVTRQCTNVADQVWDTFLREAAPQIKNAELIAEDNARQNCIGNISSCFLQACRDTMDPNDPDGSYDMCLTRPETMLNVCKVPLNACGIDDTDPEKATGAPIWEFVVARLASMRVNSCTTQFKECLQADTLCGSDYTQCVGLDTDTIVRMCPYDSLPGCQQVYADTDIRGDAVYDELYNIAQGIFLGIDNNMLDYCQSALDEAIITACGSTESCDKYLLDQNVGTRSLKYELCEYQIIDDGANIGWTNCRTDVSQISDVELGRDPNAGAGKLGPVVPLAGVVSGTIYWDGVEIDENGNISSVDEYFANIDATNASDIEKQAVSAELIALQNNLNTIYSIIDSDPTVQFCTTGREVQGIKPYNGTTVPRFPGLAKSAKLKIATNAVNTARDNYYKRYDEINEKMAQDQVEMSERMAEIKGENGKDARREQARQACVNLAEGTALPKVETPKSIAGIIFATVALVAAAVLITVFTAGVGVVGAAGGIVVAGLKAGTMTVATATGLMTATPIVTSLSAAGAGMVIGATAAADWQGVQSKDAANLELSGRYENEQWNYRETITTDFNMDTLVCHKCITTQQCEEIRSPLFGAKSCKQWADASPAQCSDIQF